MSLQAAWEDCRQQWQAFTRSYFPETPSLLEDSMLYTLTQGKKFRPFLSYASAHALNLPFRQSLGFAVAIEMVHAFSLIHDDLPALDNDDSRRGEPTNHIKFGEDIAILAGDALLNEAYLLLSKYYKENPQVALQLVALLAHAVGREGMIEGQIRDLKAQAKEVNLTDLKAIHHLKTGKLIEASVLAPSIIKQKENYEALEIYAKHLGLAFQIADDLLEKEIELGSYVHLLGVEGAKKALAEASECALEALKALKEKTYLEALVKENQNRTF